VRLEILREENLSESLLERASLRVDLLIGSDVTGHLLIGITGLSLLDRAVHL
jgi:hypothetical protein